MISTPFYGIWHKAQYNKLINPLEDLRGKLISELQHQGRGNARNASFFYIEMEVSSDCEAIRTVSTDTVQAASDEVGFYITIPMTFRKQDV